MPRSAKGVIDLVQVRARKEGVRIDPTFRSAMSNYRTLLGHESARLRLRPADVRFVEAVISARTLHQARALSVKVADANLFHRSTRLYKIPPFDPDDPCTGAARVILSRRTSLLNSDLGGLIQELSKA